MAPVLESKVLPLLPLRPGLFIRGQRATLAQILRFTRNW